MPRFSRRELIPVLAATLLIGAIFAIAWLTARGEYAGLRWMHGVPRATLASPRVGPAVYSGTVVGPEDRVTPLGRRTAGHWWWVVDRSRGEDGTTVCHTRVRDGMRLVDGDRVVRLTMFETAGDSSLLSDHRTWDWRDAMVFDLGSTPEYSSRTIPRAASRCTGRRLEYTERWIPPGARVEVLACMRDGALGPCNGPLTGALSIPNLDVHRIRRAREVRKAVRAACGISAVLLSALTTFLVARSRRVFTPMRARPASAT